MEFKNLKRNANGSIDGDWVQDDGTVKRYTLDPDMGHIEKAEAGEWGEIEEPSQAEKDANALSEAIKQATNQVQSMLDIEAKSRGYDNINSIGKYIGYNNAFRAECEALGAWAAACWSKCYELQAAGVMPDDLLAEMPGLVV